MRRTSFSDWPCSIARTSDLLGAWWSPLVMRELFFGTTRFEDIHAALSIGRNVLTDRLKRLAEEGIVERRQYQERPPRFEYHLTEKGRDFYPVVLAMVRWGDRWLYAGEEPPLRIRHATCGEITRGVLVCEHCREPLQHGDVETELQDGSAVTLEIRVASRQAAAQSESDNAVDPVDES